MREIRRSAPRNVPVLCDGSFIAGFDCRQVIALLKRTASLPKENKNVSLNPLREVRLLFGTFRFSESL